MKERPRFARFYEALSVRMNRAGELEHRREMAQEAAGRVLEVGAGNGLNFEHYGSADVVVALEPQPTMVDLARPRARDAPVPVHLLRGVAEALPFRDGAFDTVVTSLVLCSVESPRAAVEELRRVLRPGGEIRFLEHVRSDRPGWGRVQDVVTPVWRLIGGGCHPNRDTLRTLRSAGFQVSGRRFPFGPPSPARPHVLGTARKQ